MISDLIALKLIVKKGGPGSEREIAMAGFFGYFRFFQR